MLEVEYYTTAGGEVPVASWLESLADDTTVARIVNRIERVGLGSFGDHKPVGGGVAELRMDFGPGYRLYYAQVGRTVVLLLCGGDKSSQKRDVKTAAGYLADYKERLR